MAKTRPDREPISDGIARLTPGRAQQIREHALREPGGPLPVGDPVETIVRQLRAGGAGLRGSEGIAFIVSD